MEPMLGTCGSVESLAESAKKGNSTGGELRKHELMVSEVQNIQGYKGSHL